ncbi:Phox homologous domain-containing protein [Aspergillus floccosus]
MAPSLEISIPTTSISPTSPPYTIYHIALRLLFLSFTVAKRYSDFTLFHINLVKQTNVALPIPLPSKSWFSNTVSNASLLKDRHQDLEAYLRAINKADDSRWRNSPAWRDFLNLTSATTARSIGNGPTTSARLHAAITEPGNSAGSHALITDHTVWLDCYCNINSDLHDARLHLTRRDQEATLQKQHESSSKAKISLVRAGSELRRRKDLVIDAWKDKDGLEGFLNAVAANSRVDKAVASIQDKEALIGGAGRKASREGRQTMEDQAQSGPMRIVNQQTKLGIAINAELEIQNKLQELTDEDADRLQKKVDIGKKRFGKIS